MTKFLLILVMSFVYVNADVSLIYDNKIFYYTSEDNIYNKKKMPIVTRDAKYVYCILKAYMQENFHEYKDRFTDEKYKSLAEFFGLEKEYYTCGGLGNKYTTEEYDMVYKVSSILAKRNYAQAQAILANFYEKGMFVKQDYKKAYYWYKKSMDGGLYIGAQKIADMYYNGFYVRQDYKKAFNMYNKIQDKNKKIKMILSSMYATGKGTKKNMKKACKLYKESQIDAEVGFFYDKFEYLKKVLKCK